jgi:DNA-binding transcriptional ArsR family regulator
MTFMSSNLITVSPYALLFQALAAPPRIQILELLRKKGAMNVSEITKESGLEQTQVSHNLRCLSFCGLVSVVREGKTRVYSINEETMEPLLRVADNHLRKFAQNLFTCDSLDR